MSGSMIIAQGLLAVIYVVAVIVLIEFIKAKDGELRKIMITYFIVEIVVYTGWAVLLYIVDMGREAIFYTIILALPKVLVKLWLLRWIRSKK